MTTISDKDLDVLETIVDRLAELDDTVGGYSVDRVVGHTSSAQVTYRFENATDAITTGRAAADMADCVTRLGTLARKVLADHGRRHRLDAEEAGE